MQFKKWLETYIKEKGLYDEGFVINSRDFTHFVDMTFLIDYLDSLTPDTKNTIKDMLVKIDFVNGDAKIFLEYCAKGYVEANYTSH